MASRCTICNHPERVRIEMLRFAGASLDSLVTRFELGDGGRDRLWRHTQKHVSAADRAALVADIPLTELAERAASENTSLLDHLKIVRSNLMRLFLAAAGTGDIRAAASMSGRLLEALRDQGMLTGELMKASPVTNNVSYNVFMASPFFIDLQTMLIERLRAHPEALAAVVAGLRDLEARDTGTVIEGQGRAAIAA